MLSNLDLLNRDLVLLYPRTNAKSIKIFKIRHYINCGKPLKIFIRHKKDLADFILQGQIYIRNKLVLSYLSIHPVWITCLR